MKQENKEREMSASEREDVPSSEATQNQEEVARQEGMPMRRNTIQEEKRKPRRGDRQRPKTDFYGQHVMVTQI